jgi:hypothetical protein
MPRDKGKKSKKGKKGGKKGGRDWLAPLTSRKKAKRETKAAAKLEFRPTERQIEAELRASEMRQREIPSWFSGPGGYLDKLGATQRASAAEYDKTRGDIGARQQQALSQDEVLRQRLESEERADAERRGVQYTGAPGAALAEASLARRDLANRGQDLTQLQGASQAAYLGDKARIGRGEQISQILKEQGRQRSLFGDQRELAERKGSFMTDFMRQLRGDEREAKLAEEEFGQEARESRKSRRGQRKLAKQYGKNKKKEQNRSLRNQLTVADVQAGNKAAEQKRSKKSQLRVGRQQRRSKKQSQQRSARNYPQQGGKKKGKKGKGRAPRRPSGGGYRGHPLR